MTTPAGVPSPPALTQVALANAALHLWQRTGAPLLLPVTGTSMLPLLRPGDQLVVDPTCRLYAVGAIVVFRQADHLVVHRVVRRLDWGQRLLTKGDNGPFDPSIPATDLVGVVTAFDADRRRYRVATWPWRVLGWIIAYTVARPALQRRLLWFVARTLQRLDQL
jgi:signal peptidase I